MVKAVHEAIKALLADLLKSLLSFLGSFACIFKLL